MKKPASASQKEVSNNMSPMPEVPGAAAAATKVEMINAITFALLHVLMTLKL